jgi:hypothetical protein
MKAATAAAEPPLDPPVAWAGFQGLRAGPPHRGSVTKSLANSGVFDLPRMIAPARLSRATNVLSAAAGRASA